MLTSVSDTDAATRGTTMDTPTTANPNVRIIRVRFLEDEVCDGGIPQASYDNATTETFEWDENDTREEAVEGAVRVLQREGLTFAATGTDYAADPDGSYVSNYATAERVETSGHLNGFSDAEVATIVERVG
jgi:hypothetical protein